MSNPLDLQKQTKQHPWLVLGGPIALGLLIRRLTTAEKPVRPVYDDIEAPRGPSAEFPWERQGTSTLPIDPPRKTVWDRIKQSALTALASAFTELATRAAPVVVNRLAGQRPEHPPTRGYPNSSEPLLTPDDDPFQATPPAKDLKS